MPDGSGFDYCRRMRQLGLRQPILILTAQSGLQDKLKAFEAGADAGAGTGGLAFATAGRGLAVAAAFAAADPLLAMHGTGDVFKFVEFHGSSSGGARLRRRANPDSD